MEVKVADGEAKRDGCGVRAEYKGKSFPILLSEGQFSLVDTQPAKDLNDCRSYEDAWLWHMCDEYERMMVGSDTEMIGLMSNKEIFLQQCKYCQLRIPDGLIGQWKMLNWNHMEEINKWNFDEGG